MRRPRSSSPSGPADPKHYGRILAEPDGTIVKMVEYKDASDEERALDLCNSGLMAVRSADLWPLLARVGNDNAAGEYYLPDIVMIAAGGRPRLGGDRGRRPRRSRGSTAAPSSPPPRPPGRRAGAQALMAEGRLAGRAGDGLVQPRHADRPRHASIEPNVVFGPGVTIGEGVRIRAFSHIEGATIAAGAEIGPYARLRPGAEIGEGAKVGNFVEVKKAQARQGRQGQSSLLSRRCRYRRGRQYRRGNDHLQL